MEPQVILINSRNRAIGIGGKIEVHLSGVLHRAFSIFLVNAEGEILLQRRHPRKYHSGGLWANSCCGHPLPGEKTLSAARRRVVEELGVSVPLHLGFVTRYHEPLGNGMVENEIVYVFFGSAPLSLNPNALEICETKFVELTALTHAIRRFPNHYAVWFRHYIARHGDRVAECLAERIEKP